MQWIKINKIYSIIFPNKKTLYKKEALFQEDKE
jgi:hypothetical protein